MQTHAQGIVVDSVKTIFTFTPDDLEASSDELHSLNAFASPSIFPQKYALPSNWFHVQELVDSSGTFYGTDWLDAFSLTLIAGITVYQSAEKNIAQHRRDFASYFFHCLQGIVSPSSSEFETICSNFNH